MCSLLVIIMMAVILENFQSMPQQRALISFKNLGESLLSSFPVLFIVSTFNGPSSVPVAWAEITAVWSMRLQSMIYRKLSEEPLLRKWRTHTASMWEQEHSATAGAMHPAPAAEVCTRETGGRPLENMHHLLTAMLCYVLKCSAVVHTAYVFVSTTASGTSIFKGLHIGQIKSLFLYSVEPGKWLEMNGLPTSWKRKYPWRHWSTHLVDLWGSPKGCFTLSTATLIHIHDHK